MTSRPFVRMRGEFSSQTKFGPISSMPRNTSETRPLRAPSRPSPEPAAETSWQGKPADRQSTRRAQGRKSKALTSPSWTCNPGNHPSALRSRSTAQAWASHSTAQTGVWPTMRSASNPPPAPAKRCMVRIDYPYRLPRIAPTSSICGCSMRSAAGSFFLRCSASVLSVSSETDSPENCGLMRPKALLNLA